MKNVIRLWTILMVALELVYLLAPKAPGFQHFVGTALALPFVAALPMLGLATLIVVIQWAWRD